MTAVLVIVMWVALAVVTSLLVVGAVRNRDVVEWPGCTHRAPNGGQDVLCAHFGCPDDPNWRGDGCR